MSRPTVLVLLVVALLCALSSTTAHAQTPPGPPLQLQKIDGNAKGLCLQTAARPNDVRNRLVPTMCVEMGGLQMFSFWPVDGGGYRIVNTQTHYCMDVEWGANWVGGRVLDWPCNGQDNQRWDVQYYSGHTKIRGWQSKLCLDISNAIAVQVDCQGWGMAYYDKGPVWKANRQRSRIGVSPLGSVWGFKNARSGYCMTTDTIPVLGSCRGGTPNDVRIMPVGVDKAAALEFRFVKEVYKTAHETKCLVDAGYNMAHYTTCPSDDGVWRLVQVMPDGNDLQTPITANRWQIQNVKTGRCLADSHSVLATAPCNGTPATTWSVIATPV